MYGWIGLCAGALACVLISEKRGEKKPEWFFKPLASFAFLGLAFSLGALETPPGQWIFAGLVLSWFGDVFLISRTEKPFLIGLVAFLLGHVAFLGAFFALEVNWNPIGIGVGPLVLVSALVTRWLLPHAPREMRIPIVAYILVITAMVAAAFGLWQHENGPLAIGAALCFFLSDLSVAINRFVSASFVHRLWGLPLYYLAQILFGLLAGALASSAAI